MQKSFRNVAWRIFCIGFNLAVILALTLLSEVGGFIYLVAALAFLSARKRARKARYAVFFLTLLALWMASLVWIVPSLAARYNKVPLPFHATAEFPAEPVNIIYPLFFRNYVTPALRDELRRASLAVKKKYDRTIVYLDGCFPLGSRIPLLPHLSHNDGRKVDIAFSYRDTQSGQPVSPPSPIGYWAYSAPRADEPQPCRDEPSWLRWDMGWMQSFFSSAQLDEKETGAMLAVLLESDRIQKILVEPHLKERFGVQDPRIKFQGCNAARHDDHLHVQTTN